MSVCDECGAAIARRQVTCLVCGSPVADAGNAKDRPVARVARRVGDPAPSFIGRALLALVLLLGFYVLAIAMIAALAGLLYLETKAQAVVAYIFLFPIIGIIAILWAIFPRSDPFHVVGARVDRKSQPRLFALIDGVSRETRQRPPSEVYIVGAVNAWVSQHGGVLGVGSRRVMGIGLPVLGILNVSQLRAILVHEYGHYYGGDTALGPLVYATRSVIGRTMGALSGDTSFLNWPFELYGDMFLRLTQSMSRQQEWAADDLACRIAGPHPFARGLWLIHATALVEEEFWKTQIEPVVDAGYLPPIAEGFRRYTTAPPIASKLAERAALVIEKEEEKPFDSHPVARERLARAVAMPDGNVKECQIPADSLLDDVPSVEARLLATAIDRARVNSLQFVDWREVAVKVYLAEWDELRTKHAQVIAGLTVDSLMNLRNNVLSVADKLGVSLTFKDQARLRVAQILGGSLAAILARNGWDPLVLPGPQILCQQGDHTVEPIEIFKLLIDGSLVGDRARDWARWCVQWLGAPAA